MKLYHGTSIENLVKIINELKIYTNYLNGECGCWLALEREHSEMFGNVLIVIESKQFIENLELDDDWTFYHNGILDISNLDFDIIFKRSDEGLKFLTNKK